MEPDRRGNINPYHFHYVDGRNNPQQRPIDKSESRNNATSHNYTNGGGGFDYPPATHTQSSSGSGNPSKVLSVMPIPRSSDPPENHQQHQHLTLNTNAFPFDSVRHEFMIKVMSIQQAPGYNPNAPPFAMFNDQGVQTAQNTVAVDFPNNVPSHATNGYYEYSTTGGGMSLQDEAAAYPLFVNDSVSPSTSGNAAHLHTQPPEQWGQPQGHNQVDADFNLLHSGMTRLSLSQGPLYTANEHRDRFMRREEVIEMLHELQDEFGRNNVSLTRRVDEINARVVALEEANVQEAARGESAETASKFHVREHHANRTTSNELQDYTSNFDQFCQEQEDLSSVGAAAMSNCNSTLNNQVPPGSRANNYLDNFRSYSHQNLLSIPKNIPVASRDSLVSGSGESSGSGLGSSTGNSNKQSRNRLREVEFLMNIGKKRSNNEHDYGYQSLVRQPRSLTRRNEMVNQNNRAPAVPSPSPNVRSRSPIRVRRDSEESTDGVSELLKSLVDLIGLFLRRNSVRPGYVQAIFQKLVSVRTDNDRIKLLESVMAIKTTSFENVEVPQDDQELEGSVIWKEPVLALANSMEVAGRRFCNTHVRSMQGQSNWHYGRRNRRDSDDYYYNNLSGSGSRRSRHEEINNYDLPPFVDRNLHPNVVNSDIPPARDSPSPTEPTQVSAFPSANLPFPGSFNDDDTTTETKQETEQHGVEPIHDPDVLEQLREDLIRFRQEENHEDSAADEEEGVKEEGQGDRQN